MSFTGEDSTTPITVYVIIPPSPLFAAHWSFFVPYTVEDGNATSQQQENRRQGRRIHVSGDRLNGFTLEIIRDYDVSKHRSVSNRRFAVGRMSSRYIRASSMAKPRKEAVDEKDEDEGGGWIDRTEPIDEFERVVAEVKAPGPSLNRVVAGEGVEERRTRIATKGTVRDCQWWVREVVGILVDRGMLQAIGSVCPRDVVAGLPVH